MSHSIFHTQLCHTPSFTTPSLSHTIFHHPIFHTHTTLSHSIFDTTSLTHTIFHTPSQAIFHTPLCHTPSLTHHLSHTTLSHTIFHQTIFVTHHLSPQHLSHTHNFVTHHLSSTSSFVFPSFPVPATTFLAHYWKKLTCGVIRSFYFKLTTSKMKQFCETSFKNGKLSAELTASCQCVLRFFDSTLSKLLRLRYRVIRSAAPVTQNHLSKPEDLMLQNATLLRKSAPGPPNSSDEHVSCTAPATENASLQILFKCPTSPSFLDTLQNPQVLLTFDKVHNPERLPRETTSDGPKVLRTRQFFALLTSKCASRHNGVHFFDISTSKSGPDLVCFVHFDFEMCFPPQRRALFRHLNFQNVLLT